MSKKMTRDQEKAMFAKNYQPSGKSQRIPMPRYMPPSVKSPTMLMTKQMRKEIPPLYSTENKKPEDITVHAHYFTPFSSYDWYITEYDGKDTMFGLVKGHDTELGYVSLSELESQGMNVERDRYWNKKSLASVMKETGYRGYKPKESKKDKIVVELVDTNYGSKIVEKKEFDTTNRSQAENKAFSEFSKKYDLSEKRKGNPKFSRYVVLSGKDN